MAVKGNFSYSWCHAATGDNSLGDVSFTNIVNISGQTDDSHAICVIGSGQTTNYIKFTKFDYYPTIPSGATISGVMLAVKGYRSDYNTPVYDTEVRLIKNGFITGLNFSDGQQFGSNYASLSNSNYPMPLYGLSGLERGSLELSSTDLTYDDNFGFAARWSGTNDVTIGLDAAYSVVYWYKEPAAAITATTPLSIEKEELIGAHAMDSYIGDHNWSHCKIRWYVSAPEGWSLTSNDTRRGASVYNVTRDWKKDIRGRVFAIRATVVGTYKIWHELTLPNGSVLTSSILTYEATARTGTTYHIKPSTGDDSNTGLSEAQAWATFSKALSSASDNCTILLYDDEVFTPGAATPSISNKHNWYITRSNTGSAKPQFNLSTGQQLITMVSCTDMIFKDINFGNYTTALFNTAKPSIFAGYGHTRLCVQNCDAENITSFLEITSLLDSENLWIVNNNVTRISRYFVFTSNARWVVIAGNTTSNNSPISSEGNIRLPGMRYNPYGVGANVYYNYAETSKNEGSVVYATGNPSVCYNASGHDFITGQSTNFYDSTGTSINGARTVTVIDNYYFSVPVNVTVAGSATYRILSQPFIRPGWTHVDVWANRSHHLLFSWMESSNEYEAHIALGNRFAYNDINFHPTSIAGTNQRGNIDLLATSNVITNIGGLISSDWRDGDMYWTHWNSNTIINNLATSVNDVVIFDGQSSAKFLPVGTTIKNNLVISPTGFAGRFINDASTLGLWTQRFSTTIANNVYNHSSNKWVNAGSALSITGWNNLDAVSNETLQLDLLPTTIIPQTDWLPSGLSLTHAVPGHGDLEDYRLINRNINSLTQANGAVGLESLPSAPTGVVLTASSGSITLSLGATGSLLERVVYKSLSPSGPFNWLATVTANNYTDTGLSNGQTYYYTVSNRDSIYNFSDYSSVLSATPSIGSSTNRVIALPDRSIPYYSIPNRSLPLILIESSDPIYSSNLSDAGKLRVLKLYLRRMNLLK